MLGSFFAFVITIVFYAVRKVLKFSESMSCIPDGFKAMVPAILILTFAWTLKAMTDSLGAKEYVAEKHLMPGEKDRYIAALEADLEKKEKEIANLKRSRRRRNWRHHSVK